MRPSRRMMAKALTMTALAGVIACGVAFAQYYDPAVRSLGPTSDVNRSPRLVGMGGLSLVVPDRYNDITFWNFAGAPIGAYKADTSASLDLRPGTQSAAGAYDPTPGMLREILAGRATGLPFEVFYRNRQGNAVGAVGSLSTVETNSPRTTDTYSSQSVSQPKVMPIITGPFPYWGKGKLLYAVDVYFARQNREDHVRDYVVNAEGMFLSLDGYSRRPTDFFTPISDEVRTFGTGLSFAYPMPGKATLAVGIDRRSDRFSSSNDQARSLSQITEDRPTTTGQATLIGHLGKAIEYGVDSRWWSATSDQRWMFTISSGSGVAPLSGRGNLLGRDEHGTAFRSRARWTAGRLEVGAAAWSRWSRVQISPPKALDATAFNRFLTQVYYRVNADTLMLPDSIVANDYHDNAVGFGGGASWKLTRGIAGVEYHWAREAFWQTYAGTGPKTLAWDVRGGYEYECSKLITGRIGYGFGWNDDDDHTAGNEWTTRTGSLGLGVHPTGASWAFDIGYSLAWSQSDFGDPTDHRFSRQNIQTLVHWNF